MSMWSFLADSLSSSLQGVRSVLPRLPGGLRRVERGGGVHVSRAAAHRSVQPAGAVPQPGLPLPVSALHAAGHQHGGCIRQVKLTEKLQMLFRVNVRRGTQLVCYRVNSLCSQGEPRQRLYGSAWVHHTGPGRSRLVLWVHTEFFF